MNGKVKGTEWFGEKNLNHPYLDESQYFHSMTNFFMLEAIKPNYYYLINAESKSVENKIECQWLKLLNFFSGGRLPNAEYPGKKRIHK